MDDVLQPVDDVNPILAEQIAGVVAAFQQLAEALVEAVRPVIEAVAKLAAELHAAVWRAYRADGMPYGESEEGLHLWIEMLGRAYRARERLLEEHAWNVAMTRLRDQGHLST